MSGVLQRVMLVGETGSGKSALIRRLSGLEYAPRKALAVEYVDRFINTPGEFLENSRYYHALITSSADCRVLLLVQNATKATSLFPPLFAPIFNRPVIGVVTDACAPGARARQAERFLCSAGARQVVLTDTGTGTGFDALASLIEHKLA